VSLNFDQFEVLTFDCYGTLIDWETGILNAVRPVLKKYGRELTDEAILKLYSEIEPQIQAGPYRAYREVLAEVMRQIGERNSVKFTQQENDSLAESIKNWEPFPDTVDALKRLKTKFGLGIISNIDKDLFADSARKLQVDFDNILTADMIASYKPAKFNFDMALMKLGRPKEKILHIAESLYHDIVPAQAQGLKTVWVNRRAAKGYAASKSASATPDMEVADLKQLADAALGSAAGA
jgi:2-haloacid dehalogenase